MACEKRKDVTDVPCIPWGRALKSKTNSSRRSCNRLVALVAVEVVVVIAAVVGTAEAAVAKQQQQ